MIVVTETEDEVQISIYPSPLQIENQVLLITYQTPPPATTTTPGSTPSRHYDKFKMKTIQTPSEIPVKIVSSFQGL